METNSRKEILQVSGLTIVIVMAIIANLLVVGLTYRWHQWQVFAAEKKHNQAYKALLLAERAIKDDIVLREGAQTWNDTLYIKSYQRETPQ